MSIKSFVALSSMLVAVSAFAQAPLGTVGDVQGLVTVTDGATGGTATTGSPITNGMRFIATPNGTAVLRLNNCVLTLHPGQAVTVLESMTCQQLAAAVQQVGGVAVAGQGGGSFGTGALGVAGLVGVSLVANKTLLKNNSLSGN